MADDTVNSWEEIQLNYEAYGLSANDAELLVNRVKQLEAEIKELKNPLPTFY